MNSRYVDTGTPQVKAIEECSELIKALCKADRFALDEWHPNTPRESNRDKILSEIEDVVLACENLRKYIIEECPIDPELRELQKLAITAKEMGINMSDEQSGFADDWNRMVDANTPKEELPIDVWRRNTLKDCKEGNSKGDCIHVLNSKRGLKGACTYERCPKIPSL